MVNAKILKLKTDEVKNICQIYLTFVKFVLHLVNQTLQNNENTLFISTPIKAVGMDTGPARFCIRLSFGLPRL